MTAPAPDALLSAGVRQCSLCGRANFPVDATWINDELILVSHAVVCPHLGARFEVITADQLNAEFDVELLLPGRLCAGRNRRGRPCGSFALTSSRFCYWHRPGREVDSR